MPVAALYDIHGNLPALEAVLEQVRAAAVDQVIVGGDVVPGPMPQEVMDRLLGLEIPVRFIRGNGDREVLELMRGGDGTALPDAIRSVVRHSALQLTAAHREAIAG